MDFYDMNFSQLFLEKHGKEVYDNIFKQIMLESYKKDDKEYSEIVFKIAFFNFWGFDNEFIKKLIEDTMKVKKIDIEEIKLQHTKTIKTIQKYIKSVVNK